MSAPPPSPAVPPSLRQALPVWVKIGLLSFGGPTGQIALMHAELVEKRRWVSEARFVHALNYCMLLPGPEAQQLSIYIGWLLHGVRGGLVAGTLFVLPGALLLWAISWLYVTWGTVPALAAVFAGLKPAVLAIVAFALLRLGGKILRAPLLWLVAAAAFGALYFGGAPFPAIVLTAVILGFVGARLFPRALPLASAHGAKHAPVIADDTRTPLRRPNLASAAGHVALWTVVWLAPVAAAWISFGADHVLVAEGLFFSKAALVTFGGAYAVLPYVAQQAVETHGWLTTTQMIDGLGLAETTPGPLILVLQYVGFLGAWSQPGALPPLLAATLGAAISTWCTFVPGFLFIFAGAPFVEALRANDLINRALSVVTAAVVGVILNLALWFGVSVLRPAGNFDGLALALSLAAFAALQFLRWDVLRVVLGCAAVGILFHLFTAA